jgi:hypothetical protein
MKKYIILLIMLVVVSVNINGQEGLPADGNQSSVSNVLDRGMGYVMKVSDSNNTNMLSVYPEWMLEELDTPYTNHTDTFVEAFSDPNILIGVFENGSFPNLSGKITDKEIGDAMQVIILGFHPLHLVKPIKGEFNKSYIFIKPFSAPGFERRPQIPNIYPVRGSKWVLALRKTSQSYRNEVYGKEIEKYDFLNENTLFRLFRYGYGALCLKWPDPNELPISSRTSMPLREPDGLLKIPESMIEDLDMIQKVMPILKKEIKDSNDTAAIAKTTESLKNDLAKSIFTKLTNEKIKKTP